jgi:hypothetical protein
MNEGELRAPIGRRLEETSIYSMSKTRNQKFTKVGANKSVSKCQRCSQVRRNEVEEISLSSSEPSARVSLVKLTTWSAILFALECFVTYLIR